jgi:ABC-2 type transport system permease protein
MTRRMLAYVALELATFWKRPINIMMFVVLSAMSFGFLAGGVRVSTGSADTGGAKNAVNSAFNLAFSDMFLFALILPFFTAIACGMPVLGDFDRRIHRLVAATPISHVEYAFARMAGAVATLAAVLAAWLVVQIALHEFWPIDPNDATRVGFSLGSYLWPLVLFALPTVLFVGGVSMWAGARTRMPVLVFALPVVFLIGGFFIWVYDPEWLTLSVDRLMQALDPAGVRWFIKTFVDERKSVEYYNASTVVPDALFVLSRLAFIAIGLVAVWATGRRLDAVERRDARVGDMAALLADARRATPAPGFVTQAAIAARGGALPSIVRAPGFVRGTLAVLRSESRMLVRSPGVWLFGPLILLQVWGTTSFREGALSTEVLATTGSAAAGAFDTLTLLLCFLTLFYTVESLVREERCGLSAIFRAAPVPTGAVLAGKVLANAILALVIIACAALAILLTILFQWRSSGIFVGFEVPTLLLVLGALLAPTLVVWCAFTAFVYALVRNRFAVYGIALAALVGTGLATQFGYVNWLTAWHLWSAVRWSELDRLAFMWDALLANRLLVLALAAFFIVATLSIWPRRAPDLRAVADRMRPAAMLRAAVVPMLAALPVVVLAVWVGLSVRGGFQGGPAQDAQRAYWKRNSATWEDAPVPALDRVDGEVRLFPEDRRLEVVATIVLRNPHVAPMAEVPITVGPHFRSSGWTVDGVASDPEKRDQPLPAIENRSNLYVVIPAKPLGRDESVEVSFRLEGEYPEGWTRYGAGSGEFLLPSGVVLTSFGTSFLPVAGYLDGPGIDERNSRDAREYARDHWKSRVDPAFGPAWATDVRLVVEGPEDWILNVVGVEKESTVVDGRRRTLWETDHPVRFFNIVGGPLVAAKGASTTVYHSPATAHNVPTMVRALDAARNRYSAWFGPYPWENLRVTQFPGLASYAQGFPGNITFSEDIGFMTVPMRSAKSEAVDPDAGGDLVASADRGEERPGAAGADESDGSTASDVGARASEREEDIDLAFYIVAHESGHQWWGNIVMPGKGPGGNIISEGLAEFSALMLVHHELGEGQARTLRRRWERAYVFGRSPDDERSINRTDGTRPGDTVVTYNRAGFVFWMLRDLMGEERMLAGLRAFVEKWKSGVETPEGLDFPLIEDMVESLRAHAPDAAAFDAFVAQWIYGTALPDLEIAGAKVLAEAAGGGASSAAEAGVTTEVTLAHRGTGVVDVVVRAEGAATGNEPAPFVDEVVRIGPGETRTLRLESGFRPVKVIADPEVRVLLVGRKRCEQTL